MLKRTNRSLILFISSLSISLGAMQGPAGPARQTSQCALRKSASVPNLQAASTANDEGQNIQHAFEQNFPDSTILKSKYINDATSEEQLIKALVNMPWIKETQEGSTEVKHVLDVRNAEEILRREILAIERPKIVKEMNETAQKSLSFIQQNPVTSVFLALAIGASLPFVVPKLIEKTVP